MQRKTQAVEIAELAALLFLHAMALGAWLVPLGTVLDAHGYQAIKPLAFATSAIAAFVSPLFFAAIADRHVAPVRVLSWLTAATSASMALAAAAIQWKLHPWLVLALIQFQSLCSAPTWGITSAIVLGRLSNSGNQFGPMRAMGTLGWMVGCWVVSILRVDTSTTACYIAASIWLAVAVFARWLPGVPPPKSAEKLSITQRLGLDALGLLKVRDHRVVFFTAALLAVPFAAFYPFTPTHLRYLGLERTSAWMTLGQVSEIFAMVTLARMLGRWRLKWTIAAGLMFGFFRYALCTLDARAWVLAGVALHGFAYTFVFITAQIYMDQRIDSAWRVRAQALLMLMIAGVGNLAGYLGTGAWFQASQHAGIHQWPMFWGGLAVAVAAVLVYFLVSYRGQQAGGDTVPETSAETTGAP